MDLPLYRLLASLFEARRNCEKSGNEEWFTRHGARIEHLALTYFPHGSGVDSGASVDMEKSTPDKLIIHTSFHHMNDVGMYDEWTDHTITVRASLAHGFSLSISGRNRHDIKDYLHELFHDVLTTVVPYESTSSEA
jgi:hypothetical protein